MKPLGNANVFCCPCGCDTFYMPATADIISDDVTCCRCRKGYNPYTGKYIDDQEANNGSKGT